MSIDSNQSHLWTTWEDLLLSCAVKRFGLSDWSNVAMELQSRASKLHFHLFTAQICCSKFYDLKRRYAGDDAGDVTVPWIDELRNIRIAELRDIVEKRGMAIQSLDSKVKRLEEERERNREDNETGEQKPDPEEKICKSDKNDVVLPENDGEFAGDSFSGERSERENRSVNESNSSENQQTGEKMEEKKVDQIKGTEPVQTSDVKRDEPARKPVQADSWNDSSKLIEEKKANNESAKVRDSIVTESKGATDGNEAQSSASLMKKSQSSDNSGGGDGDEPVVSESHGKTTSHDSVKNSEPLVRFLNIIRSSKHGSVFVVRLESQKTEMYNGIIKQHMDLETVQTRVSNDIYSSCTAKFYLDLLLLFNNAIVYFPKSSPESSAAFELRKLVLDELRNNKPSVQQSNSSPESAPSIVIKSEPDAQKTDLLLAKQKIAAPCTISGKRSYITSKPSTSNKTQKQDDNVGPLAKTSSSSRNEEESSLMLMLNEKPVTGARSMRRSSNIRTNNTKTSIKSPISDASVSPGSSTIKESEAPKAENKKKADSVLDFLERLEKSSPAKEEILDTLKSLSDNNNVASSRRGTREQPKKKVNERKESITGRPKRGGGGKHAKEEVSPSKRNVGRPPKRGREAAVLPPGKRGKEVLKEEEVPAAKRPNKRSKK